MNKPTTINVNSLKINIFLKYNLILIKIINISIMNYFFLSITGKPINRIQNNKNFQFS